MIKFLGGKLMINVRAHVTRKDRGKRLPQGNAIKDRSNQRRKMTPCRRMRKLNTK